MAITKQGDNYKLDFYPEGRAGKRVVKLFPTKKAALHYQKQVLSGQTKTERLDNRRLSEFITLWYDLHGQSLRSAKVTRQSLIHLSDSLNDPVLRLLSVSDYAMYRQRRLESGITESTLNRQLIVLKSLYRELKRLEVIAFEFPLLNVRKLKQRKMELSYLTKDQIKALFESIDSSKNPSLKLVSEISLATGARWSECQCLKLENVRNGGFYFTHTKNGESRFVPVSPALFTRVQDFLKNSEFKYCYGAYRSAFKRSGLSLPTGQLAHVLRHTFASHFIMSGGNILALQKILGHSSLQVTMIYSHLSPDYLNQAVALNPLENPKV